MLIKRLKTWEELDQATTALDMENSPHYRVHRCWTEWDYLRDEKGEIVKDHRGEDFRVCGKGAIVRIKKFMDNGETLFIQLKQYAVIAGVVCEQYYYTGGTKSKRFMDWEPGDENLINLYYRLVLKLYHFEGSKKQIPYWLKRKPKIKFIN
jgi:hypothetical protein